MKAELFLLLATAIWGGTFAIGKIVLLQVSPLQMVFVRFGIATVLTLLFAGWRIFPIPWRLVAKGVVLSFFLFVGFMVQTIGLTITTASKSAFITGMAVVFVPLLQIIVERQVPRLGNLVGVGLVSVGLWLLTQPEGSAFNTGDALTLVCSIVFAVYIVYLDVVSREMRPLQLTFIQFASTALFAVVWLLPTGGLHMRVDSSGLVILAYLTLFATVLTTSLQTRYQRDTTPTRAAVIFTVEPVFAAVIAYALLSEKLGTMGFVGGALILGGVLISELAEAIPFLGKSMERRGEHSH